MATKLDGGLGLKGWATKKITFFAASLIRLKYYILPSLIKLLFFAASLIQCIEKPATAFILTFCYLS